MGSFLCCIDLPEASIAGSQQKFSMVCWRQSPSAWTHGRCRIATQAGRRPHPRRSRRRPWGSPGAGRAAGWVAGWLACLPWGARSGVGRLGRLGRLGSLLGRLGRLGGFGRGSSSALGRLGGFGRLGKLGGFGSSSALGGAAQIQQPVNVASLHPSSRATIGSTSCKDDATASLTRCVA